MYNIYYYIKTMFKYFNGFFLICYYIHVHVSKLNHWCVVMDVYMIEELNFSFFHQYFSDQKNISDSSTNNMIVYVILIVGCFLTITILGTVMYFQFMWGLVINILSFRLISTCTLQNLWLNAIYVFINGFITFSSRILQ